MSHKDYFLNKGFVFLLVGLLLSPFLHFFSVPILVFLQVIDIPPGNPFSYFDYLAFIFIFLILVLTSNFNKTKLHYAGFWLGAGFLISEFGLRLIYFPEASSFYAISNGAFRIVIISFMGFVLDIILRKTENLTRFPFWGPLYFLSSFLFAAVSAQALTAFLIEAQNITHFEGANGYAYMMALPVVFITCLTALWILYFPIRKKMKVLVALDSAFVLISVVSFLRYRNDIFSLF